jgi:hypothetical protein
MYAVKIKLQNRHLNFYLAIVNGTSIECLAGVNDTGAACITSVNFAGEGSIPSIHHTSKVCCVNAMEVSCNFLGYYWSVRHDLTIVVDTGNACFIGLSSFQ